MLTYADVCADKGYKAAAAETDTSSPRTLYSLRIEYKQFTGGRGVRVGLFWEGGNASGNTTLNTSANVTNSAAAGGPLGFLVL
jgi:hypothetical protein